MNNAKVERECTSSFSIVASAMVRTSSCTSKWKSCVKKRTYDNKSPQLNTKEFKIKRKKKKKKTTATHIIERT
jgi:hypothetical protein